MLNSERFFIIETLFIKYKNLRHTQSKNITILFMVWVKIPSSV